MCCTCIAVLEHLSCCLMTVIASVFALAEVLLSLKGVTCPFSGLSALYHPFQFRRCKCPNADGLLHKMFNNSSVVLGFLPRFERFN